MSSAPFTDHDAFARLCAGLKARGVTVVCFGRLTCESGAWDLADWIVEGITVAEFRAIALASLKGPVT